MSNPADAAAAAPTPASSATRVPVWLEFGSYAGPPWRPNDMTSRAEYTRLVRKAAEQGGIAWAYWELDGNFGIFNPKAQVWREPLLHALVPRS